MQPSVDDGYLLQRSAEQLQEGLNDFVTVERRGVIVGCAGLKHYTEQSCGEIYALVVNSNYYNTGVSAELMGLLFEKAKGLGLVSVFALSKYSGHFFVRNHFDIIEVENLPKDRQTTYDHQRAPHIYQKYC
ncbi:MAG: GNAT family N-acetyltransferase [Gammaproteobacteria bacterium]|nr:GNAT family N-acetyltransferase [Gammaproteobacteria bacterium]